MPTSTRAAKRPKGRRAADCRPYDAGHYRPGCRGAHCASAPLSQPGICGGM